MYCSTNNVPPRGKGNLQAKAEKATQQRWFDSPDTLVEKFDMANSLGVKGFGMWYMDAGLVLQN